MAINEVFTIGYEGREIDDFIDRLKKYRITRLIDVREIPLSRKKGFSKTELRKRVESAKIEYFHFRSLGSPSNIRHRLKIDHNYERFFKAYGIYLENNNAAISEAYDLMQNGLTCIMCFERFPEKCHRSTVVQRIKEIDGNGLNILHI